MALNLLHSPALHVGLMLDLNLVMILRLSKALRLDYLTLTSVQKLNGEDRKSNNPAPEQIFIH